MLILAGQVDEAEMLWHRLILEKLETVCHSLISGHVNHVSLILHRKVKVYFTSKYSFPSWPLVSCQLFFRFQCRIPALLEALNLLEQAFSSVEAEEDCEARMAKRSVVRVLSEMWSCWDAFASVSFASLKTEPVCFFWLHAIGRQQIALAGVGVQILLCAGLSQAKRFMSGQANQWKVNRQWMLTRWCCAGTQTWGGSRNCQTCSPECGCYPWPFGGRRFRFQSAKSGVFESWCPREKQESLGILPQTGKNREDVLTNQSLCFTKFIGFIQWSLESCTVVLLVSLMWSSDNIRTPTAPFD